MQNPKAFVYALLVPALLALSGAEAPAQGQQRQQRQSADAIRAECFRQANEAAGTVGLASPAATAERNARGLSAYRDCARRKGIRP